MEPPRYRCHDDAVMLLLVLLLVLVLVLVRRPSGKASG